jgi:hypothetical protein
MDHRWQFSLGMIKRGEQPLNAIEREVDALGMQRSQTCDYVIDMIHTIFICDASRTRGIEQFPSGVF